MKNIILLFLLFIPSTRIISQWTQTSLHGDGGLIQSLGANGSNIYATNLGGPYYSTNQGSTWLNLDPNVTGATCGAGFLFIEPYIFGVGSAVFRTSNNGTNWTLITNGLLNNWWESATCLAEIGTSLFAGTNNSIMVGRSTDNGDNWSPVNIGLGGSYVKTLLARNSKLYAGTYSGGIYISTNNGDLWTQKSNGMGDIEINCLAMNANYIFAGTMSNGIYRSSDEGESWESVNNGLVQNYVQCITAEGDNIFIGCTYGIFLSTNNGTSWTSWNSGFNVNGNIWNDYYLGQGSNPVYSIVINGSYIYAGLGTGVWSRSISDAPLPVELTALNIFILHNKVILIWKTSTEVNNYGFEIERTFEKTNWKVIGFVEGHGNSNSPKEYSYTDNNPPSGNIFYRLKQIDFDGKYEYSDELEINMSTPTKLSLNQNYPNPFNPTTKIEYSIPEKGFITIKIFDVLGREISTIVNELKQPGNYQADFDGSKISSGVYFYRLQLGNIVINKKMLLVK